MVSAKHYPLYDEVLIFTRLVRMELKFSKSYLASEMRYAPAMDFYRYKLKISGRY